MALQITQENYTIGEDVDFDELNDRRLQNILQQNAAEIPNSDIDTRNLSGLPSSPTKPDKNAKKLRIPDLKETPIERINRLKRELRELKENLETIRQREKDIKIINPETQISLLKEIEGLQNQLTSIYQNEDFLAKGQNKEGQEILDLKTNLKQQQAEALLIKLKQIQSSKSAKNEQIIYKIGAKSQDQVLKNENKIGDLENRIAKLETTAREFNMLNLINEVLKVKELVEAAIVSNQDAVTKKLNQVFQEMDTLNHKRQNLELNDPRYVKVAKMHENFLKLQRIGEILPEIITRLECLKFIHEDSVNIHDNIEKIANNKIEINTNLQTGNSLLNQVCTTLDSNLPKIKSEIQLLTEKVEKLASK